MITQLLRKLGLVVPMLVTTVSTPVGAQTVDEHLVVRLPAEFSSPSLATDPHDVRLESAAVDGSNRTLLSSRDAARPGGRGGLPRALSIRDSLKTAAQLNGDRFEVTAIIGGLVTFGATSADKVTPSVVIDADGPLVIGSLPLARIGATLALSTAPGQTLNLGDPKTFQAANVDLFVSRIIGRRITYDQQQVEDQDITTEVVVSGGFSSRLGSDPEVRLAKRISFGPRFRERVSRASLSVLWGRDELGGARGWGQWRVIGHLPVPATKGTLVLYGDVLISIGPTSTRGLQQDVFRIGAFVDLKEIVNAVNDRPEP